MNIYIYMYIIYYIHVPITGDVNVKNRLATIVVIRFHEVRYT